MSSHNTHRHKVARSKTQDTELIVAQHQMHSGPIPDPETLARYNEIIPNGAERILAMAEKQSAHRISTEKLVISKQLLQSQVGQWLAFFLTIFLVSAGIVALKFDYPTVAGTIFGLTITSVCGTFIYGKIAEKRDLDNKKRH
jgi:uncharacterized membrane protein